MLAFEGLYNAHLFAFLTRTNFEARCVIITQIFGDLFNRKRNKTLKIRYLFCIHRILRYFNFSYLWLIRWRKILENIEWLFYTLLEEVWGNIWCILTLSRSVFIFQIFVIFPQTCWNSDGKMFWQILQCVFRSFYLF